MIFPKNRSADGTLVYLARMAYVCTLSQIDRRDVFRHIERRRIEGYDLLRNGWFFAAAFTPVSMLALFEVVDSALRQRLF